MIFFRIRERTLLVCSLFVMFLGLFLYLPWGPGYPKIKGETYFCLSDCNGNRTHDYLVRKQTFQFG